MPFTIGGEWVPSDKSSQNSKKIQIYKQKRKGKVYTIIANLNLNDTQQKLWLQDLRKKCHCGGSLQDQCLQLQGDHEESAKEFVKQKGQI